MSSWRSAVAAHFRRTEGKLTLVVVGVLVCAVVAGLTGALSAHDRADLLDDMAYRRGGLNTAAGEVYRALADADATAFSVVLVTGERVAVQRQAFRDDVVAATAALDYAAKVVPEVTPVTRLNQLTSQGFRGQLATAALTPSEALAVLSSLLPIYTGMVESGWVYTSRVDPVGTSYLNEASLMVRGTMLEIAKRLRDAEPPSGVNDFPWFATTVGLLVLAVLLWCQRFLARRTRRRFNAGMVAATALTAVAFGWLLIASTVAAAHATASAQRSARLLEPLTEVRAEARGLDGDEARALIFPLIGDTVTLTAKLDAIDNKLNQVRGGDLDAGTARTLEGAARTVTDWRRSIERDFSPDRPGYGEIAADITAHEELKETLDAVIAQAGADVDGSILDARTAVSGTGAGVVVLMALAALAGVAGLWPRIAEYR
ncbi:hypothetical protein V5P93_002579 [Actinokineospora auranticolor]|uniref:Secreted protein n=1 Tax=Actinokineospora auranticolor TaxID=155976 RepID=A0A2S6GMC2_9PSEU|nr:hypothetical protein [Actinokineospora auranticolor]PPK66392.1 hypothetical protein CLV40_11096 [Actinokineospora auranticolor]